MNFQIDRISAGHVEGFRAVLESVARECERPEFHDSMTNFYRQSDCQPRWIGPT